MATASVVIAQQFSAGNFKQLFFPRKILTPLKYRQRYLRRPEQVGNSDLMCQNKARPFGFGQLSFSSTLLFFI
jgi:hypothetical protein